MAQINLTEAEIHLGIKLYLAKIMSVSPESEIKIDLAATRGPQGFTASVSLELPTVADPFDKPAPATPVFRGTTDHTPTMAQAVLNQRAEPAQTEVLDSVSEPVPELIEESVEDSQVEADKRSRVSIFAD